MTVSGNLVSEIKFGKLAETLRVFQDFGMVDDDFRRVRKDHDLALEVFRIIRDSTIFKNVRYSKGYEQDEQIERFKEWNNELVLGIPDVNFDAIPKEFLVPPISVVDALYCTCLVYEFGDPLETLLQGFRILDYELQKIKGRLDVAQSLGGIFEGKSLNIIPEKIPSDKVRFRPEATARKKGFRFITAELGRMPSLYSLKEKKGWQIFSEFLQKCDQKKIKNLGQELPYVAAMYPGWTTSFCGDSRLYPRPLALDIQVDDIYKTFYPKNTGGLCLRENLNSNYPTYGKDQSFKIEASDFEYDYITCGIIGRGYSVCTIIQET
mgnify:CR=1 FL=1